MKSTPRFNLGFRPQLRTIWIVLVWGITTACHPMNTDPPSSDKVTPRNHKLATFGGGCFWCMEAVFERLEGVQSVVSGYAGGTSKTPTYKEVCSGNTGHAEVIQIEFDPEKLSYEDLLDLFWQAHDPTTPNRQGADVGSQYRSIILYHDPDQKAAAETSKKSAGGMFKRSIITEILPLEKFYPAEAYHQDFFQKNPSHPYCSLVIHPKLQKLGKPGGK